MLLAWGAEFYLQVGDKHSFGTNVIEAALCCLAVKPDEQITSQDLLNLIERIPLQPQIEVLN